MVLDVTLLNTQHYKVRIKGKWTTPGKGTASSQQLDVVTIEKGGLGSPSTKFANFIYIYIYIYIDVPVLAHDFNAITFVGGRHDDVRVLA